MSLAKHDNVQQVIDEKREKDWPQD
jgi:hypothetical protein